MKKKIKIEDIELTSFSLDLNGKIADPEALKGAGSTYEADCVVSDGCASMLPCTDINTCNTYYNYCPDNTKDSSIYCSGDPANGVECIA